VIIINAPIESVLNLKEKIAQHFFSTFKLPTTTKNLL